MRDDGTAAEAEAPRRHIIKRPRLTRLLDQADARILMLVAPAGYGKTTLAREWIEGGGRKAFWITATPALNDVATFALRLRDTLHPAFPSVGARIEERFRTGAPALEPEELGAYLTDGVDPWPDGAWLVIDDYQHLDSAGAESLIESFINRAAANVVVATRRRPTWATARRVLYGEIYEVGQNSLAMTRDEAAEVLGRQSRQTAGLIGLADGWPAILGLAARSAVRDLPQDALEPSLYDYFAEELYRGVAEHVRSSLTKLAFAPRTDITVATTLLGSGASEAIAEGERLGFLQWDAQSSSFVMHSLLKDFLRRRHLTSADVRDEVVPALASFYAMRQQFDELFVLVSDHPDAAAAKHVIDKTVTTLLLDYRIEALGPWLDQAKATQLDSPAVDLAAAEFAFRDGRYSQAELLATRSAARLPETSALKSLSLFRAGISAYHENRSAEALPHHRAAVSLALRDPDRLQAIWGLFTATLELEGDVSPLMEELEAAADRDPAARVRLSNARLGNAYRFSGINAAIADGEAVMPLVERVRDPMITSAFLNSFAACLVLAAQYERALGIVEQEVAVIDEFKLSFAIPHALASRAAANMGRRRFSDAVNDFAIAERLADRSGDDFSLGNIAVGRIRLALSRGRPDHAAELASRTRAPRLPSLQGEIFAAHALALAATGNAGEARALLDSARALTRSNETRAFADWAYVVAASVQDAADTAVLATTAFKSVSSGCAHPFICAYRAYPKILQIAKNEATIAPQTEELLRRANDATLAKSAGFSIAETRARDLSPRETEVLRLLTEGLANREIADRLFISEVTAKAHVHNVLTKLKVRSRTEAALIAREYLSDGD